MSLTQTEQRICDLEQRSNVQRAKIAEMKKALLNNTKLTADETLAEVVKLRAANDKLTTITEEFDMLAAAYKAEILSNPALSKVLFAGSKAA